LEGWNNGILGRWNNGNLNGVIFFVHLSTIPLFRVDSVEAEQGFQHRINTLPEAAAIEGTWHRAILCAQKGQATGADAN
jgi:hypothetical protein